MILPSNERCRIHDVPEARMIQINHEILICDLFLTFCRINQTPEITKLKLKHHIQYKRKKIQK